MSAPIGAAPRLILSPPSTGKTEYVLASVRALSRGVSQGVSRQPILCVPTPVQRRSAQARLANLGGAFGLRIFTFDTLWAWILDSAHQPWKEPVAAAQFRLMEDVLADLAKVGALAHFGAIAQTAGLVEVMRERMLELAHARVEPNALLAHWQSENAQERPHARLLDIAHIYRAWQEALAQRGWVDRPGVGRLALECLRRSSASLFPNSTPIFFDGFDFLTELQVQTVAALAVVPNAEVTFTLTGDSLQSLGEDLAGDTRFHTTRRRLERTLGVRAVGLPTARPADFLPPALRRLHERIIVPTDEIVAAVPNRRGPLDPDGSDETTVPHDNLPAVGNRRYENAIASEEEDASAILLLEATQRATEARAALRWIKRMIVEQQVAPSQCALIVRDLTPWRPLIVQVAAEFGVPVAIQGGMPLRDHPLIGWLERLLDALRPDESGAPTLPRDAVVELWRSPWQENGRIEAPSAAADLLDQIARRALLIQGLAGWQEALALALQPDAHRRPTLENDETGEEAATADAPANQGELEGLAAAFVRWLEIVTPPPVAPMRQQVDWLGTLVQRLVDLDALSADAFSSDAFSAGGDAALNALAHALRGMVWTAEAMKDGAPKDGAPKDGAPRDGALTYTQFLAELGKTLESALYTPPMPADGVFVGTVVHARGVPFAYLALLGLAEGEIPQRMVEDPFLRQNDRIALRTRFPGIQTEPYGIEREYFEETLARAERGILLTRPLLSESGARSEPSPFWIDVQNLLRPPLQHERAGLLANAADAASLPELLRTDATADAAAKVQSPALRWLHFAHAGTLREIEHAATIVRTRTQGPQTIYEGDLHTGHAASKGALARRYPADHVWNPTALEGWIACHYLYFAGRLLGLETPALPEEGVARWQVGQIYHDVLAEYFAPTGGVLPDEARLSALIAHHLAVAPAAHGFLDTPAWRVEAREIEANIRRSVAALHEMPGETIATERRLGGANALQLQVEGEVIPLRGVIDRLDLLPDGGYRVIDYKTGKSGYDAPKPLAEGKRLQLALYALAVEQTQGADSVADALYFFVHKGEPARWSLATFEGGPQNAYAIARSAVAEAVAGIRSGNFVPKPPDGGCPDYCPAAAWCWRYTPRDGRR